MPPSSPPPPPVERRDPYAPPAVDEETPSAGGTRTRIPGEDIKWVFAAFAAAAVPLRIAAVRWQHLGLSPQTRDSVRLLAIGVIVASSLALACWVYAAWTSVPIRHRAGRSPLGAVFGTVAPFPWWQIVMQLRLCDGIDAALAELGELPNAPKVLGGLAGATVLLPSVLFLLGVKLGFYGGIVADAAWLFYMFDCDGSRRVLVEAQAARRARELREAEVAAARGAAIELALAATVRGD